ncbi:hypothetical protein [Bacillus haynesii]|uniref:hypothetical protein n=1 Tax=Bacillus haynesii TaxID=1925021 RepID=UPI0035DE1DB2
MLNLLNLEDLGLWVKNSGVDYFLYTLLFLAVLFITISIVQEPIKIKYRDWNYRVKRTQQTHVEKALETLEEESIVQNISLMLRATAKKGKEPQTLSTFFITSFLCFLFVFVIMFVAVKMVIVSLAIGLLAGCIPYAVLVAKLNRIRIAVGNEFLRFIQIFSQQYNANGYDIQFALRSTLNEMQDKDMKKALTQLISDLNTNRDESGVRKAVQEFVYINGSNWSKRLGNILVKGYLEQQNVLKPLLFLVKQVEKTEEMIAEEKSEVMAVAIEGYMQPVILIGSLGLGVYTCKMQGWWQLQFGEHTPLMLLAFGIVGVIFSVVIGLLVQNIKNDV